MKFETIVHHKLFKPALGAALTIIFGIALWLMPLGERWRDASYDYLFRFGARGITNDVVLVLMDNESYDRRKQYRTQHWHRGLHAELLSRLADDQCALVVFDVSFRQPGTNTNTDLALANAMARLRNVVLMAEQAEAEHQPDIAQAGIDSARPTLPLELFLNAAKTNWGVAWLHPDLDEIVRRHWPFPSSRQYPSLPWTAAEVAGAKLDDEPQRRWLRYYAPRSWTSLSYWAAQERRTNYFRNKTVFIGNSPNDDLPNGERDEFRTPHTRWTGRSVGGMQILATEFLNLFNGEWLRRPAAWIEALVLVVTGAALGVTLMGRRVLVASAIAVAAAFAVLVGAVCLTYYTDYWFPWLVISGAQVPLALMVAIGARERSPAHPTSTIVIHAPTAEINALPDGAVGEHTLDVPDYELIKPPFGKGAYGKVWLARNAVGQWQAVKAIYRARFGEDASPYEREFRGLERYQRVSHNHPGLLRVDFVSRMKPEGYFYYAMELGDAVTPGWEQNPATYKPLDLAALCAANNGRLPARECARIGVRLCDALQYLHSQGLAHRDIKPRNTIFVSGQPKLADVGLVADAQRPSEEMTWVGTPGFMPPDTEPPGTPQADIYSLGIMLYVISTGGKATSFPELSTTIVDHNRHPEFGALSRVIFKACNPDRAARYASVTEMCAALSAVEAALPRDRETV